MTLRACSLVVCCVAFACAGMDARAETSGQQRAESAGQLLIGKSAPRLVLNTIDGQTIDLGRLYGKQAVYLKFWATWCVPCRQQMPHFERTYEAAGPDLAVIAVNSGFNDSVDDVRAYRVKLGITMPIVVDDGQLAAAFNLRVTPQHIVIGRDGRVLYVGHLADAKLDAALLAARMATASTTKVAALSTTEPSGSPVKEPPAAPRYTVGDQLPPRSPTTVDGRHFPFLAAHASQQTVLVFFSPWCESYLATTRPEVSADCRRMREQVSALAASPSARWLGIASGLWATPQDVREYRHQYGVHIPLSLDDSGDLFRAFNVNHVPTALVADGSGRIIRRIEAADLANASALRSAIRAQ
jgi:thiol-disulfide isomerase/thioredoxin